MLTSPINVTIGATTYALSKINQDNFGATYLKKTSTVEVRLNVRHSYEKANASGQYERHNLDLQYTTYDVDGNPVTTQSYAVVRARRSGDPVLEEDVGKALSATFTTLMPQLVAWES